MAKLSEIGVKLVIAQVLFTGEFDESPLTNRDGENYIVGKLKNPVTVRCSMDNTVEPVELDELHMTREVYDGEGWEGNAETGLYIPGFKADFSKNLVVGLYQAETIRQWARGQRDDQKKKQNQSLKDRIAELKAKKGATAEGSKESTSDAKPEVTANSKPAKEKNKQEAKA